MRKDIHMQKLDPVTVLVSFIGSIREDVPLSITKFLLNFKKFPDKLENIAFKAPIMFQHFG